MTIGLLACGCSNKRIASDLTLAPLPSVESTIADSTTSSADTLLHTGTTNPNVTRPSTPPTIKPPTVPSTVAGEVSTQTTAAQAPGTTNLTTPSTVPTTTPHTVPATTTKPTTPPTTTPPPPPGQAATAVLAAIPVSGEHRGAPAYKNASFAASTTDGAGCNTAQRVLIRDSITAVVVGRRCSITSGRWASPWEQTVVTDPTRLTLVRTVSLKEAWDSGAFAWSQQRRDAFANDMSDQRSLAMVSDSVSQSRGDRDPAAWLPPTQQCEYLANWLAVKARWGLTMDPAEAGSISSALRSQCPGLRVDDWPGIS
ncbi:MAG: hypothetical protein F2789_07255 [Actinobacteria bacterium]|nr:hypothetical protein [Actinomycetota bacterium]